MKLPFFVSIPHSGEQIPSEVTWLKGLPEPTLMRDVDRFVDQLYAPTIKNLQLPAIISQWHRYVVDLNRKPDEYDTDSVVGAPHPSGTHPKGLHWSVTTFKEKLIPSPMSMDLHLQIMKNYYQPFHDGISDMGRQFRQKHNEVFHLDLHSMPSLGTPLHPDPGETRAEVVISDQKGQSASVEFRDLVLESFQRAGFQVAYNWPYVGGGITQTYGEPKKGFHTIQIELNRAQYMDEETKKFIAIKGSSLQAKLQKAMSAIHGGLTKRING